MAAPTENNPIDRLFFQPQSNLPALFEDRDELAATVQRCSEFYRDKKTESIVALLSACFRVTERGARGIPNKLRDGIKDAIKSKLAPEAEAKEERAAAKAELVTYFTEQFKKAEMETEQLRREGLPTIDTIDMRDRRRWSCVTFVCSNPAEQLLRGSALFSILRNVVDAFLYEEYVKMRVWISDPDHADTFLDVLLQLLSSKLGSADRQARLSPERLKVVLNKVQELRALEVALVPESVRVPSGGRVWLDDLEGSRIELDLEARIHKVPQPKKADVIDMIDAEIAADRRHLIDMTLHRAAVYAKHFAKHVKAPKQQAEQAKSEVKPGPNPEEALKRLTVKEVSQLAQHLKDEYKIEIRAAAVHTTLADEHKTVMKFAPLSFAAQLQDGSSYLEGTVVNPLLVENAAGSPRNTRQGGGRRKGG